MKLSFKVLQVVLASTVALNGVMAHAQESQATEAKAGVTIQAGQIAAIDKRFDELKQHQLALVTANKTLAAAIKTQDGYVVDVDYANKINDYAATALKIAAPARVYMVFRPEATFTRLGKTLSTGTLVIGTLAIGGAFLLERNAKKQLKISEGDMTQALADIENLKRLMVADEEFIKVNSAKLGAVVTNNIVSFEGVVKLPDGLKWLGGNNGSSLMLGQIPQ